MLLQSEGGGHPGSLLNSESDGLDEVCHLGLDGLRVVDEDWLSTDDIDQLTNGLGELELERLRDQKNVKFPGPFLDLLGVLGESCDLVQIRGVQLESLGLLHMVEDSNDADFELSLDWVMKNDS